MTTIIETTMIDEAVGRRASVFGRGKTDVSPHVVGSFGFVIGRIGLEFEAIPKPPHFKMCNKTYR